MPYCITCGKEEAKRKLRRAGPIARRKAHDIPDIEFSITGWKHKHIGFVQYLKCKRHHHDCYIW